ncbi:MAG: hypothetical protein GY934_14040 [Gammaproteobacteria bacterium]|nr:hypothetical protein [Gammaproteobacteria bacterium]
MLAEPIAHASRNLHARYAESVLPLSDKNHKISLLNRKLHTETALSYLIYVEDTTNRPASQSEADSVPLAIHQALSRLAKAIYLSAETYEICSSRMWKTIHRLYLFAEQNNLHRKPLATTKNSVKRSIYEIYLDILLFSIISPHRLRQREIGHIIKKLGNWSPHLDLNNNIPPQDSHYFFVIPRECNTSPIHISMKSEFKNHLLILNTQRLITALKEKFDQQSQSIGNADINLNNQQTPKQLLRQIIQSLGTPPVRKYVRTRLQQKLTVAVSLTSIYQRINHDLQETIDDHLFETSVGKSNPFSIGLMDDPLADSFFAENSGFEVETEQPIKIWDETPTAAETPTPYHCTTLNENAGGYCIRWIGRDAPEIKIGELLGILSERPENEYAIGIVRWIKQTKKQGLAVGIELVANKANTVIVRTIKGSPISKNAQHGLQISWSDNDSDSSTLLLPPLTYQNNDRLEIKIGSEETHVQLTRLLGISGAYAHFQFERIEKSAIAPFDEDDSELQILDPDDPWLDI